MSCGWIGLVSKDEIIQGLPPKRFISRYIKQSQTNQKVVESRLKFKFNGGLFSTTK